MGLLNDVYDLVDVKMTEHEKGKQAAARKKVEIQDKKNRLGVK